MNGLLSSVSTSTHLIKNLMNIPHAHFNVRKTLRKLLYQIGEAKVPRVHPFDELCRVLVVGVNGEGRTVEWRNG